MKDLIEDIRCCDCTQDSGVIRRLRKEGYKPFAYSSLRSMKKKELIELIRCLENNWCAALERCDNQYEILCGKISFGEVAK